jgi:hypothetical protein
MFSLTTLLKHSLYHEGREPVPTAASIGKANICSAMYWRQYVGHRGMILVFRLGSMTETLY